MDKTFLNMVFAHVILNDDPNRHDYVPFDFYCWVITWADTYSKMDAKVILGVLNFSAN